VTSGAPPLFDVGQLRSRTSPALATPVVKGPTVVLGSTQAADDLDARALELAGAVVRRRRGGGGAVLLRPGDVWIEWWLPTGCREAISDLRATAYLVGSWWLEALSALGVAAELHRGDVRDPDQGAIACFAGLGPGELTVGGHKLVGVSQWRTRNGALVSTVACERSPATVREYLAGGPDLPSLDRTTSLHQLDVGSAPTVLELVVGAATSSVGTFERFTDTIG